MNAIKNGFSILELITTVMILTILVVIFIPFYHNAKAKQEAQHIPVTLRMHLQHAKQNAVLYRNNVVICSSEDLETCSNNTWATGLISFLDVNQNRSLDQNEIILSRHSTQLRYGSLRWQGSLNFPSVVFQGDTGLPRGSMGSFYYCSSHNAGHNKVILSSTGIARSEIISSC